MAQLQWELHDPTLLGSRNIDPWTADSQFKHANEIMDVTMPLSRVIDSTLTITEAMAAQKVGAGLTIDSVAIAGLDVDVTLSGGTEGSYNLVSVIVTVSNGDVLEVNGPIRIVA